MSKSERFSTELSMRSRKEFLTVNIYPTSRGWMCAAMIRRTGTPYAKTVGETRQFELPESVDSYAEACHWAAERLLELWAELS